MLLLKEMDHTFIFWEACAGSCDHGNIRYKNITISLSENEVKNKTLFLKRPEV